MRPTSLTIPILLGGMALGGLLLAGMTGASVGPAQGRSPRGGLLAEADSYRFEVFFFPTGVRVYPQGQEGTPIDVSNVAGTATFYHPDSPEPWFSRPLRPEAANPGQAPDSLVRVIDLVKVPTSGAKVTFMITGLPGSEGGHVVFELPFEPVATPPPPATAATSAAGAAPSQAQYTYGLGYYGYGYYPYAPPGAVVPGGDGGGAARQEAGLTRPLPYRDWSTGRTMPLAKPWLSPPRASNRDYYHQWVAHNM